MTPADSSGHRFPDIAIEQAAHRVGAVEIRRPPNNFFDADLLRGIDMGIRELVADGCRSVVLCSEGKHFCAGAQLGDDRRHGDVYAAALGLFECPVPVVVAAQGAVVGGGIGLALVGDIRVGTPKTVFRPNFAQLGFSHGFGLTCTLPSVVGHHRAARMLLSAKPVPAEEAHAVGLLDEVVEEGALRSAAVAVAEGLAANAPLAVRSIREQMQAGRLEAVRAAIDVERAEQGRLMRSADFREGVRAARERRKPEFSGSDTTDSTLHPEERPGKGTQA